MIIHHLLILLNAFMAAAFMAAAGVKEDTRSSSLTPEQFEDWIAHLYAQSDAQRKTNIAKLQLV